MIPQRWPEPGQQGAAMFPGVGERQAVALERGFKEAGHGPARKPNTSQNSHVTAKVRVGPW